MRYLINTLLSSPQEVLFTLLIFILSKQLDASPLQLMFMASLKPITSLASFYLTAFFSKKPRTILFLNTALSILPCFYFPFTDNVWFFILAYALFYIGMRASYPAWIEILKRDFPLSQMSKTISWGNSLYYGVMIFLPLAITPFLDAYPKSWKIIFIAAALIKSLSIVLLFYLKDTNSEVTLINPFKQSWDILKRSPYFTHYLLLFFIGGAGIIGTQSILPDFFKQGLQLNYTQLALAFSFCKGVAFVCSAPCWHKYLKHSSLYLLNGFVDFFSCLFFIFLLLSNVELLWLYPAYISYGTMQAGCQLSWNLSGAVFSAEGESVSYSNLNLALVGLRGMICPPIGYLIYTYGGANGAFLWAFSLCFAGILYSVWLQRRYNLSY